MYLGHTTQLVAVAAAVVCHTRISHSHAPQCYSKTIEQYTFMTMPAYTYFQVVPATGLFTTQDRKYTIAYDIYSETPLMGYTPAEGEMEFCKLTDLYAKILTWTTVSSNNADMEVMQDPKYQKNIGFFADFKASLGA